MIVMLAAHHSIKDTRTHNIGDGMSSIGNNGGASTDVTGESFGSCQTNVGGKAESENLLAFLSLMIVMRMRVTVADMPSPLDQKARGFAVLDRRIT